MKTRNYILLTATMIAAVLAGCQKKSAEPKANAEDAVEKTFYGSTTNSEKTTLASDFNTLWTTGDKIKVYANGGAGKDFTLTNGAGTSYGEFSGSTAATGPYVAVYPSTAAQSVSGTTATITLPATQSITAAGTFADGTVPMVAYSTNDFLNFKNVGSLLCLNLKTTSGTAKLTQIVLKGNNSENLAGTATVNAFDPQPKAVISSGSTKLTVNCSNITLTNGAYTNVYIFVPAGVFTKGFTATLIDADNKVEVVTTSKNLTTEVSNGQIFSANVNFKATTGSASRTGGTVKWVQLWYGGPKWAESNINENLGYYYCWGAKDPGNIVQVPTGINYDIQYDSTYDTARRNWGNNWMMPKKADFDNLIKNCTVTCTTISGRSGYLCTSKVDGYTNNSVFFPAMGYWTTSDYNVHDTYRGIYWTSTPYNTDWSDYMSFNSETVYLIAQSIRTQGFQVRAILHE